MPFKHLVFSLKILLGRNVMLFFYGKYTIFWIRFSSIRKRKMKIQGKICTPTYKISRKGRFECHSVQNYFITLLMCSSYHLKLLRKERNGFRFPSSAKLYCCNLISIRYQEFFLLLLHSAIFLKQLEETKCLLTVLEINL